MKKKIINYLLYPLIVSVSSMFLFLGYSETHDKFSLKADVKNVEFTFISEFKKTNENLKIEIEKHVKDNYLSNAEGNIYKTQITGLNGKLKLVHSDLQTVMSIVMETNRNVNNFINNHKGETKNDF